jgi:hypothetical protein
VPDTRLILGIGALAFLAGVAKARADAIPYPDVGTPNPVTYTFTAATSGDIIAYFAGASAGYDNELGLLVNGVSTGVVGLDDHTAVPGQQLDLGFASAGSVLTFVLQNNTLGLDAYSNPALNLAYDIAGETGDGHNHVYSTAYTSTTDIGGGLLPVITPGEIPAGTYVAFEDGQFNGLAANQFGSGVFNSDMDYNDETFIFTEVAQSVPDRGFSIVLLGIGLAGISLAHRHIRVSLPRPLPKTGTGTAAHEERERP